MKKKVITELAVIVGLGLISFAIAVFVGVKLGVFFACVSVAVMLARHGLIGIAAVAFLVYIFTYYIDGEMGVILLAFLIISPLVSLFFTVYAKKRIRVSLNCEGYVKKGSKLNVTVTVEKNGFFPLSVIEIKPFSSEVFGENGKSYRITMFNSAKRSFEFSVDALVGGNGVIGIESVYSCGFLGFMKLKVTDSLPDEVSVGVIPEIPDVKTSSQLCRAVADSVVTSDEEEENDSAILFSANTTPGYEHREYVQGDPLKRINWKISTKKSKLMVRLDEAVASVQPVIILDLYRADGADAKTAIITEEKIITSAFGLLTALLKSGIPCRFAYRNSFGEIVSESVDSPEYPAQLILKVLSVRIVPDTRIDFTRIEDSACACVIATTDAGAGLVSATEKIENKDGVSLIGVSADSPNSTDFPLWYLDADNNFKMV